MNRTQLTAIALTTLLATGCATDDPNRKSKQGAVIGALAGAVIGNQSNSSKGKVIGAAIGGVIGYKVGQYQDRQQAELETALADELATDLIDIQRLDNDVLRLNLSSEASFDVNRADLKTPFYPSLDKITEVIAKYDQTLVNVIGHTDDSGAEQYNQVLSERRSATVADYLRSSGIPSGRLSIEGKGELEPRYLNDSAQNRTLNRRVEIDLVPVVKDEG